MRKLSSIVALGVVAAMTAAASANTIQPILQNVVGPIAGQYTYTYDLQLTPNNGLSNNASFPSSLVIVDFGVVTSASLTAVGGNVTAVGDWAAPATPLAGAPSLPNAVLAAGVLTLNGTSNSASCPDGAALSNVVVKYTGAGLAVSGSQRSLIQLTIVSSLVPGPVLQSLSMNTALGNVNQADTFPVVTAVPVPAAAWAGLSTLGGLGVLGALRKRRSA